MPSTTRTPAVVGAEALVVGLAVGAAGLARTIGDSCRSGYRLGVTPLGPNERAGSRT